MPFNLGGPELFIILAIVLIVFGAGKLPNVMRDFGRGVKEFKKAQTEEELTAQSNQSSTAAVPPAATAAAPASPVSSAPAASNGATTARTETTSRA